MNLTSLKFITTPATQPKEEIIESQILCQNCNTRERASTQSFLCDECIAENKEIHDDKKSASKNGTLPVLDLPSTITQTETPLFNPEELPLEVNAKTGEKSIRFAPPSIRYDGKQLDEIMWAMLPAIPEQVILDINKQVLTWARTFVSQETEPTVQDMDVLAEALIRYGNMIKQLSGKKKLRIIDVARPEVKRLEKERKEKEKAEKIQSSIPKDVVSKHTANILLDGIATITSPAEKDKQSLLKKFLDYVNLQSQMDDEISAEFLNRALAKPMYQPIKQYFKIAQ